VGKAKGMGKVFGEARKSKGNSRRARIKNSKRDNSENSKRILNGTTLENSKRDNPEEF
jgi:hypothetical protein